MQVYSQTCSNSVHWNRSGNAKLAEAHKKRDKMPGTNKVIEMAISKASGLERTTVTTTMVKWQNLEQCANLSTSGWATKTLPRALQLVNHEVPIELAEAFKELRGLSLISVNVSTMDRR